jgi:FkbM family methyltransferase
MLKDRVQPGDRREFMKEVAEAFNRIPAGGFKEANRYTNPNERITLFCMRRNKLSTYQSVSQHRWPVHPLLDVLVNHPGRGVIKRCVRRGLATLQQRTIAYGRSFVSRAMNLGHLESKLRLVEGKVDHVIDVRECTSPEKEPLVEVCKIGDQILFFSYPSYRAGLGDAVWRAEHDHYLTRMISCREGDVVIDVGAHVGVQSIALAKKYPFIKVYALEPDPLNYASLNQNIERNGASNVTALNMALSEDGLPRTLYTSAHDSAWASTDARMTLPQRVLRTSLVESITLEGLFKEFDIAHCRILKVTALGATYKALERFTRKGSIDLVCGEVDLCECSKAKLEMVSWQIARQHFWRTISKPEEGGGDSWIQQLPHNCEISDFDRQPQALSPISATGNTAEGNIDVSHSGMWPDQPVAPSKA